MNSDPRTNLKDVRLFPERRKKSSSAQTQPVKSQKPSTRKTPPKPISPDEARREQGLEALDASGTLRWASTGNAALKALTSDGLDGDRARRLARQIATDIIAPAEAKAAGPMDTAMFAKGAPEPSERPVKDTAVQAILEKDAPGDQDALRSNLGIGAHSPDRRRR